MSKFTPPNFNSLQNETSFLGQLNAAMERIKASFDNTLSRDGSTPNQMGADLDVNSNHIVNMAKGTQAGHAVEYTQLQDRIDEMQTLHDETETFKNQASSYADAAFQFKTDAAASATRATLRYNSVPELLASMHVAAGVGTQWQAANYLYEEAASDATDHHVETAGGVKLYVLPPLATSSFGVIGDVDDRTTWQRALDNLKDGDTLYFPSHLKSSIVNAVGTGATIVDRRAHAVANNGLRALTCDADDITIIIDGEVTATSPLDDLFRLTGKRVTVAGNGLLKNSSGEFLDTNMALYPPDQQELFQWLPSLVRLDGEGSGVEGRHGRLRFLDTPTVGAYIRGNYGFGRNLEFRGGRTTHGTGTMQFGIYAGMPSVIITGQMYRDIIGRKSVGGGAAYSLIFGTSVDSQFDRINGYDMLEHVLYLYGQGAKITNSHAEHAGFAAYQVFSSGLLLQGCTAIDCNTAFDGKAISDAIILGNEFRDMRNGGVTMRKRDDEADTSVNSNITIQGNRISLAPGALQSPIDVQLANAFSNLVIADNLLSGGVVPGAGIQAGIRVVTTSATTASKNLTIRGNQHVGHAGYSHYLQGGATQKIKGISISNETLVDVVGVGSAPARAMEMKNCVDVSVCDNTAIVTAGSPVLNQILRAPIGNGNERVIAEGNKAFGLAHTTVPIADVTTDGGKARNTRNGKPNYVDFTMTNAASLVVTGINTDWGVPVTLMPLNADADTLQRGANAIRWSATSIGQFTVVTISGAATGTATAKFRASWEQ